MTQHVYNDDATRWLWRGVKRAPAVSRSVDLGIIIDGLQRGGDPRRDPDYRDDHGIVFAANGKPVPVRTHDLLHYLIRYEDTRDKRLYHAAALALEQGSDPQERDPDTGDTFLHYVAKKGSSRLAAFLVENGVDANARAMDGRTPLHIFPDYLQSYALDDPLVIAQARTILALMRAGTDIARCVDTGASAPKSWHKAIHSQLADTLEFRQKYGRELAKIYYFVQRHHIWPHLWEKFDKSLAAREMELERPENSAVVEYVRGAAPGKERSG